MATIRNSAVRERVNNPLNIKVHRGTHQIGGCLVWRMFGLLKQVENSSQVV